MASGTRALKQSELSAAANSTVVGVRRQGTMSVNAALLEALRADLLKGNVPAGVRLKIPTLCDRYGVSPGAVREALSRLVSEGLVEFADQRGFKSTPISAEGLRDITRIRILIESEALTDSMKYGDARWEGEILAAQHRLSRADRSSGDIGADEWSLLHKEFHLALISACHSPWLLRLHNLLYDQTERYRLILINTSSRIPTEFAERDVEGEHDALVKAVIARDKRVALELIQNHLKTTESRVEAAIHASEQPADE